MGQIAGHSEQNDGPAAKLGFRPNQVVLELGWDDDCDDDLRIDIEEVTGTELLDGESGEVADVVLQWWREDDGDLTDALIGATPTSRPAAWCGC